MHHAPFHRRRHQSGETPWRVRRSGMRWIVVASLSMQAVLCAVLAVGGDPPNPFGNPRPVRSDAIAGAMQLSDGRILAGRIYLTRNHKLRIYDLKQERIREIPLRAVREINAIVQKEWAEREWRFKANADNKKIYTGRTYPARIYLHEIKLKRGDSIRGALAALVYLEPNREHGDAARTPSRKGTARPKRQRYLLHKRDKGKPGQVLKELLYVRRIIFGPDAEAQLRPRHKPRGGPAGTQR